MTWLYVPGMEDLNLRSKSSLASDIRLFVTVNGKLTRQPISWRGWKTRPWIKLLSGIVLKPSKAEGGVDAWISSLRAIRASRSAVQEKGAVQRIHDIRTLIYPGLLMRPSPRWSGSKMYQDTLPWDILRSKLTWKQKVIALKKDSLLRLRLEQTRRGKGYSSLPSTWATPAAADARGTTGGGQGDVRLWPTPAASDGSRGPDYAVMDRENTGGMNLVTTVSLWPTPTVMDSAGFCGKPDKGRRISSSGRTLLGKALEMGGEGPHCWPTPTARGYKDQYSTAGVMRKDGKNRLSLLLPFVEMVFLPSLQAPMKLGNGERSLKSSRQLNPRFAEWLMGVPLGWTEYSSPVTGFSLWLRRMRLVLYFKISQEKN